MTLRRPLIDAFTRPARERENRLSCFFTRSLTNLAIATAGSVLFILRTSREKHGAPDDILKIRIGPDTKRLCFAPILPAVGTSTPTLGPI
ncbi:hypothetical protein RB213_008586 [Colletotrichum asianum]